MAIPFAAIVQGARIAITVASAFKKKINTAITEGKGWRRSKFNAYHMIQAYMYLSTKKKFGAQGISPSGSKKWWKPLTPNYKKWKMKYAPHQRILKLKGFIGGRAYDNQLIKSIKKVPPNPSFVLLKATVPHALTHQKGSRKFNIPKRPYFVWTTKDKAVRGQIFQSTWMAIFGG